MSATHDLDSVAAANATTWAAAVDDTANRSTSQILGRLTNVAGTNAITGRLAMSAGFAGIATGARGSFIPANNNTGAVTLQLQETDGTNVGSAFALRDADGVALDADALVSGRLYTFEYDAVDGFARLAGTASEAAAAAGPSGLLRQVGAVAPSGAASSAFTSLTSVLSASFACNEADSIVQVDADLHYSNGTSSFDADGLVIYLYVDGSNSGIAAMTSMVWSEAMAFNKTVRFRYTPGDESSHTYSIRCTATSAVIIQKNSWMQCVEHGPNP